MSIRMNSTVLHPHCKCFMCLQCRHTFNTPRHIYLKFHSCTRLSRDAPSVRYRWALTLVMCVVVVVLVVSEVMVWALSNTPGSKSPLVSTCLKGKNTQLTSHVSLVTAHYGRSHKDASKHWGTYEKLLFTFAHIHRYLERWLSRTAFR